MRIILIYYCMCNIIRRLLNYIFFFFKFILEKIDYFFIKIDPIFIKYSDLIRKYIFKGSLFVFFFIVSSFFILSLISLYYKKDITIPLNDLEFIWIFKDSVNSFDISLQTDSLFLWKLDCSSWELSFTRHRTPFAEIFLYLYKIQIFGHSLVSILHSIFFSIIFFNVLFWCCKHPDE